MKLRDMLMAGAVALAATAGHAYAAPIKVGVSLYGLKAEFMQLWAADVKKSPAVKNGLVEVTVFDGRYDPLVQQNQIETMVAQKYDAIIFAPIDADAGATAVETAHKANVPVVGTNTRANTDLLTSYVGSDDTKSGYLEAKAVLDKIGCKGNVVIIEGPIGISAQIQRSEGNTKALAECPKVKVLAMKTANWSRAEAQSLMDDWLTRFPGHINGVIGQNDEMALGAIEAIKSANLKVSDFAIGGIDGITDAGLARRRHPCRQRPELQAGIGHLGAVSADALGWRHAEKLQRALDPGHAAERRCPAQDPPGLLRPDA
jgi:putative xylitol transport system substrate-binding protein